MSEFKNYICIDGKKAELTEKQLKALGIELKRLIRLRVTGKTYFCITELGDIVVNRETEHENDGIRYIIANYCTDENIMKQRALKETLNRLLWRFSMENGGDKIDWKNHNQAKYYVEYSYDILEFGFGSFHCIKQQGIEYFISKEIAQRAIDEIVKPFMAEHPEFVW